jgi:hypothetical protein
MASLPIITTLPVRSSCAIFIKRSCANKVADLLLNGIDIDRFNRCFRNAPRRWITAYFN